MRMDPISLFVGGCSDPEERKLRERLVRARDLATVNASRLEPGGHAQTLSVLAVELTSAHCFAPCSIERLKTAADQTLRLLAAASCAESLEGASA